MILRRLYDEQRGVCPWCGFTMVLDCTFQHESVVATVDHLGPMRDGKRLCRYKVAAHRACNNARGHDPAIRPEIIAKIAKTAAQIGLTLDRTMANHIWSQKVSQAFRVAGIDIRNPFKKRKE